MKIDWKKKLASRKFWVAMTGFVTAILVAFHVGQNDIAQIAAIISAFGTLIVYIFSEGAVDAAAAGANQTLSTTTSTTEKNISTVMSKDLNAEQDQKQSQKGITGG